MYGPYASDWDGEYFLLNGFDEYEGWPEEIFEEGLYIENRFDGPDADVNWYAYNDFYFDDYYMVNVAEGYLAAEGDFVDEIVANAEQVGFEYVARWDDYEVDDYIYFSISYTRGVTLIKYYFETEPRADAEEAAAAMSAFFSDVCGADVAIPEYELANEYGYFTTYLSDLYYEYYGIFPVFVTGSNIEEMNKYALDFALAGWTLSEGDYEGDYVAKKTFGDYNAIVEIQYDEGDVILVCYVNCNAAGANAAISNFFATEYGLEIVLPVYPANDPLAYFEPTDAYVARYGVYICDVYMTTAEELTEYVASLGQAGWTVYETEDGYLAKKTFGDQDAFIEIYDELEQHNAVELAFHVNYNAAGTTAALLAFFAEEYEVEADLPDYETADPSAYFILEDGYVDSYGVYIFEVDNTNAEELEAFFADLDKAGWAEAEPTYGSVAFSFGTDGLCAILDVDLDYLDQGAVVFYCYADFLLSEITPYNVINYIANMTGGSADEIEDLGDGYYGYMGGYPTESVSIEKLKGWCANYFVPGDTFELVKDWEVVDEDGTERCVYYDAENDVVLVFYVYIYSVYSVFEVMAYPANA